jgi:copper chaperone CopZ
MLQMTRRTALAGLFALSIGGPALAARPKFTAIYVTDMHCTSCARKIAGQLYQVPGVNEVRANVQNNLALVVPKSAPAPSPRSLWEAVERAGFQPVRLSGPSGKFTNKPCE